MLSLSCRYSSGIARHTITAFLIACYIQSHNNLDANELLRRGINLRQQGLGIYSTRIVSEKKSPFLFVVT